MVSVVIDPGNPGWMFIDPEEIAGLERKSAVLLKSAPRPLPLPAFPKAGIRGRIEIDARSAEDAGLKDGDEVELEIVAVRKIAELDLRLPEGIDRAMAERSLHGIQMAANTKPLVAGMNMHLKLGSMGAQELTFPVVALRPNPIGMVTLGTKILFVD